MQQGMRGDALVNKHLGNTNSLDKGHRSVEGREIAYSVARAIAKTSRRNLVSRSRLASQSVVAIGPGETMCQHACVPICHI